MLGRTTVNFNTMIQSLVVYGYCCGYGAFAISVFQQIFLMMVQCDDLLTAFKVTRIRQSLAPRPSAE